MEGKARLSDRTAVFALSALLSLLVVSLSLPGPAPAQETGVGGEGGGADTLSIDTPYRWIDRGVRVGLVGGWVVADRGSSNLGPGPTEAAGLRSRLRLAGPISLEAGTAFGNADRLVVDPRSEGGPAVLDTVPLRWVLAEAGVQLALTGARTWHGLQPFVSVGAGFIIGVDEPRSEALSDPDGDAFRFELNTAPAALAGLGAEWIVSDRTGISFEVRDHLWRLTTPPGFFRPAVLSNIEEANAPTPEEREWTHNPEFSLTLWYYF